MGAPILQRFRGKPKADLARPHMNYHNREDSQYTPERREFGKRYEKITRKWEGDMYPVDQELTFGT
jgi:hypothetical protein